MVFWVMLSNIFHKKELHRRVWVGIQDLGGGGLGFEDAGVEYLVYRSMVTSLVVMG